MSFVIIHCIMSRALVNKHHEIGNSHLFVFLSFVFEFVT